MNAVLALDIWGGWATTLTFKTVIVLAFVPL